jgi:hypothetical protein
MASVIAVGHGSILEFSNFAAPIRSIGGFTQDREAVDAGHLGMVSFTKKVPAGLAEPGSFECEFIFDPSAESNFDGYVFPDVTGSAGTCTVTFPAGANATAADVEGNAFVTSWTSPELTSDGLMTGTVTLQWEGGSAASVTWTEASAT